VIQLPKNVESFQIVQRKVEQRRANPSMKVGRNSICISISSNGIYVSKTHAASKCIIKICTILNSPAFTP
jgi:hypothetical protein